MSQDRSIDMSSESVASRVSKQFEALERKEELFSFLAETFRALGDSSRIQVVWALSQAELSVGDLVELLGISQPTVSHHLRMLRNLRLVKVRKEGRASYYQLDDEHIDRLLAEGMSHVQDFL